MTPPADVRAWSVRHRQWLDSPRWQERAQERAFSGYWHNIEEISQRIVRLGKEPLSQAQSSPHAQIITAVSVVSEIGDIGRFQTPRQLMAYAGLVPSEHSSGGRVHRGNITKNGNAHLRRVMVEAAWHNRHRPSHTPELRQRQRGVDAAVCAIAWSAQQRLIL
ncbi:MAG: transposase [Vulcanimicrobiaceae bacterium]